MLLYSNRIHSIVAKQRIFEESRNLKKKKVLFSRLFVFFNQRKFNKKNFKNLTTLFRLRNRYKNYWSQYNYAIARKNKRTSFSDIQYSVNPFFQSFYLYKLKTYLNFFKYFIYNRYYNRSNYLNSLKYFDVLVNLNNFHGNKDLNLSFVNNLSYNSIFGLGYNYHYIRKEKLKFRYFYDIKRYKLFIKNIKSFFKNFSSNYNNLLISYLESKVVNILYRSKFAFSLYNATQLIKHGFIELDNKVITKPLYSVQINQVIQFIPNYFLYLKDIKINYLLESFLKWYSGYSSWFLKSNNLMNNYYYFLFLNGFFLDSNIHTVPFNNKFTLFSKKILKKQSVGLPSFFNTGKNSLDNSFIGLFMDKFFKTFLEYFIKLFIFHYSKYDQINNIFSLSTSINNNSIFFSKKFNNFVVPSNGSKIKANFVQKNLFNYSKENNLSFFLFYSYYISHFNKYFGDSVSIFNSSLIDKFLHRIKSLNSKNTTNVTNFYLFLKELKLISLRRKKKELSFNSKKKFKKRFRKLLFKKKRT